MNMLQYTILRLGEKSGDIALSLLSTEHSIEDDQIQLDSEVIHQHVNHFEALIRKLNRDFYFSYKHFQSGYQIALAGDHGHKGKPFWLNYTVQACIQLSKRTSQFGRYSLNEEHTNTAREHYKELREAISNVVFGIINLNDYGLNFEQDEYLVNEKLTNMDKVLFRGNSCINVDKTPASPDQFPYWLFLYIGNNGELHVDESKITLPMKLDNIRILEKHH